MNIPKVASQRHEYFNEKYGNLWANHKDKLTDVERATLELKFGLLGIVKTGPEIAKQLKLSNKTYPEIVARRALNKLRKAAARNKREKSGVLGREK